MKVCAALGGTFSELAELPAREKGRGNQNNTLVRDTFTEYSGHNEEIDIAIIKM